MKKKTWIGFGLVMGVFLWWGTRKQTVEETPIETNSAALQQRFDALERELSLLRDKTSQSRTRADRLARVVRSNAERSEGAENREKEVLTEVSLESDEEQADLEETAFEESLETAFERQESDPAWSQSADIEANEFLGAALPQGSEFASLQCRGSLCRAAIAHSGEGNHEVFMRKLMQADSPWPGPGLLRQTYDSDGSTITIAFLGKPNSDLEEGSIWQQ